MAPDCLAMPFERLRARPRETQTESHALRPSPPAVMQRRALRRVASSLAALRSRPPPPGPALSRLALSLPRGFHASPAARVRDDLPASLGRQRNPLLATTGVVLVPQQSVFVVERLGRFNRVLEPGLHLVIPMVRPGACDGGSSSVAAGAGERAARVP